MTETLLESLLERLVRKLELDEPDGDTLALLEDELRDAEGEIALYLNWEGEEVSEKLAGKLVELAALFYRQDRLREEGLTGRSSSEGQVSESEPYQTPEQLRGEMRDLRSGRARYRRVVC